MPSFHNHAVKFFFKLFSAFCLKDFNFRFFTNLRHTRYVLIVHFIAFLRIVVDKINYIDIINLVNQKIGNKMAPKVNKEDPRTFLYLKDIKKSFAEYAESDPRFDSLSACGEYLIGLGMKADQEDRQKAIEGIA